MNKFRIKLHPLYLLIGCIFIIFGDGLIFLIYFLTVTLHEYAHYQTANTLGIVIANAELTPFGGKIECNLSYAKPIDEMKVVLAGPMLNLVIATALMATWWLFPSVYPYTEIIAIANITTLTINLLPCYPLDGGRLVYLLLKTKFKDKTANIIMLLIGISTAIGLIAVFVLNLPQVNYSLLTLAVFIIIGSTDSIKIDSIHANLLNLAMSKKSNGIEIKRIAIDGNAKLYELVKHLRTYRLTEFAIMQDGIAVDIISEKELKEMLKTNNPTDTIKAVLI